MLTGEVAMEAALRLLGKQALPRVISTPQALITKDNVETFAVKGDELHPAPARRRRRRSTRRR